MNKVNCVLIHRLNFTTSSYHNLNSTPFVEILFVDKLAKSNEILVLLDNVGHAAPVGHRRRQQREQVTEDERVQFGRQFIAEKEAPVVESLTQSGATILDLVVDVVKRLLYPTHGRESLYGLIALRPR